LPEEESLMVNVAIIGATGYGGIELVRLLRSHPQVRLSYLTSETYAGQKVSEVYPHLAGVDLPLSSLHASEAGKCDFVMLAVPAGKSMEVVPDVLAGGARVIDVSPDFRLRDAGAYRRWYKLDHTCPELLPEAAFGLPELHRDAIEAARLVAAPGCYTTAALLGIAPLIADGLIEADDLVIDAKSGVSGAGRTSLTLPYHFPEADEDTCAYSVGAHRHLPEMVQELGAAAGAEVRITFTPHVVPMSRGILLTAYARPKSGAGAAELRASLARRYDKEPFVHVLPDGKWPHTKWTTGTNHCFIAVGVDGSSGRAIIVAALDNIGKGMSGQMVQCLDVMLALPETTGLEMSASYP
jgi:N-acetyl-gamma-glutamyl-phosphate reductase